MSLEALRLLGLLLLAAWVSVDERAYGSLALHQPLIAGTLAGAVAGDLRAGMTAGLVLQGFWPGLLPIGGNLLPASGIAAVVAGSAAAWEGVLSFTPAVPPPTGLHVVDRGPWGADGPFGTPGVPLLLGVVVGTSVGWVGLRWEAGTRRRNARREGRALASGDCLKRALDGAVRVAIWDTAARGLVLFGAGFALLLLLGRGLEELGTPTLEFLDRWGRWLPPVAVALGVGKVASHLGKARSWLSPGILLGVAIGLVAGALRWIGR